MKYEDASGREARVQTPRVPGFPAGKGSARRSPIPSPDLRVPAPGALPLGGAGGYPETRPSPGLQGIGLGRVSFPGSMSPSPEEAPGRGPVPGRRPGKPGFRGTGVPGFPAGKGSSWLSPIPYPGLRVPAPGALASGGAPRGRRAGGDVYVRALGLPRTRPRERVSILYFQYLESIENIQYRIPCFYPPARLQEQSKSRGECKPSRFAFFPPPKKGFSKSRGGV